MRKQPNRVNTVILSSIPMNRKVKRYWISKYERIARNCGSEEACKKFKQLRVALLNYKADPDRKSNQDKYLSQCGFRTNGMLRALFETCDCQPQHVFNFLKLYTAPTSDRKALSEVRKETHERLAAVKANPSHPKYLDAWLTCLWVSPYSTYNKCVNDVSHPFHHAATAHSFEEWKGYWFKWRNTLRNGWKSGWQPDSKQVFPEVYKDYDPAKQASSSYESDFAQLVAMHFPEYTYGVSRIGGLSDEDIKFIDTFLDDDVSAELQQIQSSSDDGVIRNWIGDNPFMGLASGEVQHLPKKGGGTDYRDIAVPNRFIQAALEPVARRLYHLLRKLPKDATFDQKRFDTVLVNRVTNDSLYQGSVDLSKATDNLPREWGIAIVESIKAHCDLSPEERLLRKIFGDETVKDQLEERVDRSWTLFKHVSSADWVDDDYVDQWKVGQPLGSLPSFALLGITHNLYVEAMGCSLGLLHSPYVILGDDLVLFNAKLRKKYITEMTSRAIPLSLNKSYEGDLSEFAGKLYVKKCVPFHCSDHNPLTWNSLFDYQRATGIRIPWNNLPRQLKRRYRKVIANECKKDGLSSKQVLQMVDSTYDLIHKLWIGYLGSSSYPAIPDNWVNNGVIVSFAEATAPSENLVPLGKPHSGITVLGGSPVKLLTNRYTNKHGWYLRFRPVELPSWYKAKFRPCSTDQVILAAYAALRTTV